MKGIELIVVIGYGIAMMVIGLFCRKMASKSGSSFWTAEGNVPVIVNVFCFLATVMSGGGMMGNIGLAAATGITFILIANIGSGTGLGLGALLMTKAYKKSGSKTISEFIRMRFKNDGIAYAVPIIILITYVIYLIAQMKACGTVGQYLLGLDFKVSLIITWAIFTLYVMIGGMFAVTWTDFIQGMLMFGVTVVAAIATLRATGGWMNAINTATEYYPNMGKVYIPLNSQAGYFYSWVLVGICSPHVIMRISTAKSPFQATVSMHGGMILITLFSALTSIVLGTGTRYFMGTELLANNDAAFFLLIDNIFGPTMRGLTGAAIFAAIMSTAAGLLLAAAAALSNDIIARAKNLTDKQEAKLASACVLIISVVVLSLSFNPPEFLTLMYSQAMAFMVSALAVSVVLGIWWTRATATGSLLSILGGAITYAGLYFLTDMPPFGEFFIAFPVSILLMIIGSLATKPESDKVIKMVESWHEE